MTFHITRRSALAGIGGTLIAGPGAFAQGSLKLPTSAVALNVVDVAGTWRSPSRSSRNYRKAKPSLVSRVTFGKLDLALGKARLL